MAANILNKQASNDKFNQPPAPNPPVHLRFRCKLLLPSDQPSYSPFPIATHTPTHPFVVSRHAHVLLSPPTGQ